MYRFFILDNGLDKLSGHHYNQALGLIHGAKELGYEPIVYCGQIGSEIPEIAAIATPTFNKILYRPDPFINIKENALSFAQECDRCIPQLDETDILCSQRLNCKCVIGSYNVQCTSGQFS